MSDLKEINIKTGGVISDSEEYESDEELSVKDEEEQEQEQEDKPSEIKASTEGGAAKKTKSISSDDDDNDSVSSYSTTYLLGSDPLYFVLQRFLMHEGDNIVSVLKDIDKKLGVIAKKLDSKH
jgi:hypothetical protein